jgi:hypothetical protein
MRKMMTERFKSAAQKHAESLVQIFGRRPVPRDGNVTAFDRLGEGLHNALAPTDMMESVFLRQIHVKSFDVVQYTLLRAHKIDEWLERELSFVCLQFFEHSDEAGEGWFDSEGHERLIRDWVAGEPEANEKVLELLSIAKLAIEKLEHRALAAHIDELERLDRLIANAEKSRNMALRELQRYRAFSFQELQRRAIKIEREAMFAQAGKEAVESSAPKAA